MLIELFASSMCTRKFSGSHGYMSFCGIRFINFKRRMYGVWILKRFGTPCPDKL